MKLSGCPPAMSGVGRASEARVPCRGPTEGGSVSVWPLRFQTWRGSLSCFPGSVYSEVQRGRLAPLEWLLLQLLSSLAFPHSFLLLSFSWTRDPSPSPLSLGHSSPAEQTLWEDDAPTWVTVESLPHSLNQKPWGRDQAAVAL